MRKLPLTFTIGIAALLELAVILALQYGWAFGFGHTSTGAFIILYSQIPGITVAKTLLKWSGGGESLSTNLIYFGTVYVVQVVVLSSIIFSLNGVYFFLSRVLKQRR